MKKFLLATAVLFLLCAPALAQSEQIDDEIAPAALPGQQTFQQIQPLTLYSNKTSDTSIMTVANNSAIDDFVVIPNTQIIFNCTRTITVLVTGDLKWVDGNMLFLFIDNKKERFVTATSGPTSFTHSAQIPAGRHTIELKFFVGAGGAAGVGMREINLLTF